MTTVRLVDLDVLMHRLFSGDPNWVNVDTQEILNGLPVLTLRVPDTFTRSSIEFRDHNVGKAKP